MLRWDLCDFNDVYIAVKGAITVTEPDNAEVIKQLYLKIMHHLSNLSQKLMA